jgi:hypothetical protein
MTDEMIALAHRAVACKGWRWLPGMKLTTGLRLSESLVPFTFPVDLPDLSDPATMGCLLALVRESHGDPVLFARFRGARIRPDWMVSWDGSDVIAKGATEAEALVAALESSP